MCCSFTWVLINIDLAVIVGLQGPHISITSNYTHTHPHTNTLFNCKFYSWVWVSALAHKLQQQTDTINKYRCCSAWLNYCEMKGAYKYWETFPLILSSVFSFLPPFLLDSWSHPHPPLSPPFCLHFVSAVDSASITAKSNLSNHNLAGPSTPCWCLFVWSPTNEMCDKATEGVQLGIKTDFCTLKSEQIKNNRALFVVQRERFHPSFLIPAPFLRNQSVTLWTVTFPIQAPNLPHLAAVCTYHREDIWLRVHTYTHPLRVCGRRCNLRSLCVRTVYAVCLVAFSFLGHMLLLVSRRGSSSLLF